MSERRIDRQKRRGLMLVLSSPSGAGKTTLANRLLAEEPDLTLSVSATTRPPRPGEIDGKDYHFVSRDRFDAMIQDGAFLEHAQVFDNAYGTPAEPVLKALDAGRDILFDIDWQGAEQLSNSRGSDLVQVFVFPPSRAELERRLTARAKDSEAVIAQRMQGALNEITHSAPYDYIIVNDDLERAFRDLRTILHAERLKRARQPWISDFVQSFQPAC